MSGRQWSRATVTTIGKHAATVSAIYEGTVRHRRFAVRSHEFCRRLALAYIDLDELPELLGGSLPVRRNAIVRFRRSDYLGDPQVPLADAVRDVVEAQVGARPLGPIRLLANLSALGHCFNPVSFYYCMDRCDERVEAVVAEVTNTPWGERHSYVLEPNADHGSDGRSVTGNHDAAVSVGAERTPTSSRQYGRVLAGGSPKLLHVSPFMAMDHRYEWRIGAPAETLSVHIASSRRGRLAFDATLSLRRRPLTRSSLLRLGVSTLRTLPSIYAQAALLKLKGVPVHAHAGVDLA